MTKVFLKLMKEVAEIYNIEIREKASKGGIFYKTDQGDLVEVPKCEHLVIIDDFCTPIGVDFSIGKAVYAIDNAQTWAA